VKLPAGESPHDGQRITGRALIVKIGSDFEFGPLESWPVRDDRSRNLNTETGPLRERVMSPLHLPPPSPDSWPETSPFAPPLAPIATPAAHPREDARRQIALPAIAFSSAVPALSLAAGFVIGLTGIGDTELAGTVAGAAHAIALVVAACAFLAWLRAARDAARELAPEGHAIPERVILPWFVPFASWVWPYFVVRDVARAAEAAAGTGRRAPVGLWWAAWIVALVGANLPIGAWWVFAIGWTFAGGLLFAIVQRTHEALERGATAIRTSDREWVVAWGHA